MNKEELKELLKENLKVSIKRDKSDGSWIEIKIFFDGELVADDYCLG